MYEGNTNQKETFILTLSWNQQFFSELHVPLIYYSFRDYHYMVLTQTFTKSYFHHAKFQILPKIHFVCLEKTY